MEKARFEPRERFDELRGPRGFAAKTHGLWCAGSLEPLGKPCVAIVGTRAATPYGRRLARTFASDLGGAGCCIVSGLALGIDTCSHEGALDAKAPTVGVLGGGHEHFFPKRNLALAERMLASGGAVLSPFPPDQAAHPPQFLQRNGIVAALADAVVVIEAPVRSGALNTAGWAAGRIPVLAVPGDVDRPHVAGCLALIRDGAILARGASDVLEVLCMRQTSLHLTLSSDDRDDADPLAREILARLQAGECNLDTLIAESDAGASATISTLTMLEMEGTVERTGPATYALLRRR
jgi:DNA processing protein